MGNKPVVFPKVLLMKPVMYIIGEQHGILRLDSFRHLCEHNHRCFYRPIYTILSKHHDRTRCVDRNTVHVSRHVPKRTDTGTGTLPVTTFPLFSFFVNHHVSRYTTRCRDNHGRIRRYQHRRLVHRCRIWSSRRMQGRIEARGRGTDDSVRTAWRVDGRPERGSNTWRTDRSR